MKAKERVVDGSAPWGPAPEGGLDRASPVPLYYQVAGKLQQLIERGVENGGVENGGVENGGVENGEMPVGGRLPGEVELAERLGVSRPTVRRAIQYLVERGVLVRKRGIGTQIVHPKVRRPVELSSLYDDLVKAGQRPRTQVRVLERRPASGLVAEALGLPEGAEVTWIERLRFAASEPLALMHNAVPVDVLRLCAADLERRGLYQLLRAAGRVPRMAEQVVGARSATVSEARLLCDARDTPVLTMTRTAWDASGRAVEYGSHIYRASRYSFALTLSG